MQDNIKSGPLNDEYFDLILLKCMQFRELKKILHSNKTSSVNGDCPSRFYLSPALSRLQLRRKTIVFCNAALRNSECGLC